VYSNFTSKEELFLALLDRQLDRTVEAVEALVSEVAPDRLAEELAERTPDLPVLDGGWFLLEAEFLLYAARKDDPAVRERVAARQRRTSAGRRRHRQIGTIARECRLAVRACRNSA
jgi:AcrR family transcriptional regulator